MQKEENSMLKMIHNQLTDRLVSGNDSGRVDAIDHRPSIDAIVGSEAADLNVESTDDRQIYAIDNAAVRVDNASASDDIQDDVQRDITHTSTLSDSPDDLQDTQSRIREIRDWHLSKAQMSWSLETQQRHEDFAAWLDDVLNETANAST